MTTALVFGTGTGLGLWALLLWAAPPRPALRTRLARLATPAAEPILAPTEHPWATTWAQPLLRPLRAIGLPSTKVATDLRVLGRGTDTHLATQTLLALAGLLTPWAGQLLLTLTGLAPELGAPLLAGLVLAGIGFCLPDLQVRARAHRVRAEFRTALSAFVDLVWITLAGGAGIEAALTDAAAIGGGPAFSQLRRALHAAHLTRSTPWHTLRQLGDELDITELSELAASVSLAGTEGARVRNSLAAKAQALRTHQLTDAEAHAQAATERMALPVTLLFVGFLGFIAYPAVTQVLNGL